MMIPTHLTQILTVQTEATAIRIHIMTAATPTMSFITKAGAAITATVIRTILLLKVKLQSLLITIATAMTTPVLPVQTMRAVRFTTPDQSSGLTAILLMEIIITAMRYADIWKVPEIRSSNTANR